ncbi:MAG: hypothetical protein LBB82_09855 [Treponema sp.]|jgi:hypothetical protein|nr:hypothetical protein [Treponema sp.]
MFNKDTKADTLIYTGLFLIAFFVVFLSCLNPFGLKNLDTDTSIFLTIAQGITRGQVPFRDFFDNKGPLTYLISAPGLFFGGFTGVWLTELIFMYVSVFFAFKTAMFFGSKYTAFLGVFCSFSVFQSFFYEVAGTEEYSLPFMMISLYIFTKYYVARKEAPAHELMILGMCFAVSVFIRVNMFPLWLGFCLVIFFESILKKKGLPLLKYILCFFAGVFVVFVSVFIYLLLNGALSDYINQNFMTGSSRAFTGFSIKSFTRSFLAIINKNYCLVPLITVFLWIFKKTKNIDLYWCFGFLSAYLLTAVFLAVIRTEFDHYNMVLTPFLVPAFTFWIKFAFKYFSNSKYKNVLVLFLLCIVFANNILAWIYDGYSIVKDKSRSAVIAAGKLIDQFTTTEDRMIFLDFPGHIYLFTERQAASRYIYQGSGANYDKNMKAEFLSTIQETRPKIIVIKNIGGRYDHLPEWYMPIYSMIEREYRLLPDTDDYFLFIRNR